MVLFSTTKFFSMVFIISIVRYLGTYHSHWFKDYFVNSNPNPIPYLVSKSVIGSTI